MGVDKLPNEVKKGDPILGKHLTEVYKFAKTHNQHALSFMGGGVHVTRRTASGVVSDTLQMQQGILFGNVPAYTMSIDIDNENLQNSTCQITPGVSEEKCVMLLELPVSEGATALPLLSHSENSNGTTKVFKAGNYISEQNIKAGDGKQQVDGIGTGTGIYNDTPLRVAGVLVDVTPAEAETPEQQFCILAVYMPCTVYLGTADADVSGDFEGTITESLIGRKITGKRQVRNALSWPALEDAKYIGLYCVGADDLCLNIEC